MKLTDIYTSIINAIGKEVDEDSNIYHVSPSTEKKMLATVTLDDVKKRLRIPTDEVLMEADQDSFVGFHPLSESHIRGESAVITWMRKVITAFITTRVGSLALELIEASIQDGVKSSADPDLLPLLQATAGADAKTCDSLGKALRRIDNVENVLCNIFIKREGEINTEGKGKKYDRACIVRFPIPTDDITSLWGVPLRKGKVKDLNILTAVLDLVIPDWRTDAYCSGSNAKTTPYFKALMTSFFKLATAINKCVNTHRNILEDHEELLIDTSWYEIMGELENYIDEIIPLAGNIGTSKGKEASGRKALVVEEPDVVSSESRAVPQAEPVPQQQAAPQVQYDTGHHAQQPAHVQASPSTAGDSSAWLNARRQSNTYQQPAYAQPPQQQSTYAQPQPQPVQLFRDHQGNLTDQFGNPVDQYGNPLQPQPTPVYAQPQPQGGGYAAAAQTQQSVYGGGYAAAQPQPAAPLSPREAHAARREAEKYQSTYAPAYGHYGASGNRYSNA